ncbi:MAG: deoxyuridine 5'-triphosphate nucleotidohydrolase [Candidatus Margulisiibacteriota bacterium]
MLSKHEIEELIKGENLIEGYFSLDKQLTQNGFDLTVEKIFEFTGRGAVDFSNRERALPECREMMPEKGAPEDPFGWWHLKKGAYKVRTNETVNIPNDLMGFAFTRTTLLRAGAFTQNGIWDAGFCGKSEFLLVVENPQGLDLKQNARVLQLAFSRISEVAQGYSGIYKDLK